MTLAIDITDGCGFNNEARRELLSKDSKVMVLLPLNSCILITKWSILILKVGMMCRL